MLLLRVAAAAVLIAPAAAAQVAIADAGSFTITRQGVAVGHEEFRIGRASATGRAQGYIATGTVALGDRRLVPELRTNARGAVLAYRVEATGGPAARERLDGTAARGLFAVVVSSTRGETAREYVVDDGAVLLDDGVFHHYYFLARDDTPRLVPVLIPHRDVQVMMRLERAGPEPLIVGGQPVQASHLVLTEPDGARRDIWVDAEGRVLRVAIPSLGLVAERDGLPR